MREMGWECSCGESGWECGNQHGNVGNLDGNAKNVGNHGGDAGNQGGNLSITVEMARSQNNRKRAHL